jgi:hypothetical protein
MGHGACALAVSVGVGTYEGEPLRSSEVSESTPKRGPYSGLSGRRIR